MVCLVIITVSEAPKAVPIARKYDSRHELEEVKTTEQQKEEVNLCATYMNQLQYSMQNLHVIKLALH